MITHLSGECIDKHVQSTDFTIACGLLKFVVVASSSTVIFLTVSCSHNQIENFTPARNINVHKFIHGVFEKIHLRCNSCYDFCEIIFFLMFFSLSFYFVEFSPQLLLLL